MNYIFILNWYIFLHRIKDRLNYQNQRVSFNKNILDVLPNKNTCNIFAYSFQHKPQIIKINPKTSFKYILLQHNK